MIGKRRKAARRWRRHSLHNFSLDRLRWETFGFDTSRFERMVNEVLVSDGDSE